MVIFSIYIPGDVPSSKNSKVWTGKHLVHSKAAGKYIAQTKSIYSNRRILKSFVAAIANTQPPYKMSFTFIRGSRRKFDYVNMAQLPLDLMVKHEWIVDDNADYVIPIFKEYLYNKEHPGVIISIESEDK
jgi:hypothetical protein